MKWSRSYRECRNCGARRRPHSRKGYCRACFDMMERVWKAENWHRDKPKTMTSTPDIPSWTRDAIIAGLHRRRWTDDEFERYRREYISQCQMQLARFRSDEHMRQGAATGWDIERQLDLVYWRLSPKSKRRPFWGVARELHDRFDEEQRGIVYGLLIDLLVETRWKGPDHRELLRCASNVRGEGPSDDVSGNPPTRHAS
jgi:hypothetical protein